MHNSSWEPVTNNHWIAILIHRSCVVLNNSPSDSLNPWARTHWAQPVFGCHIHLNWLWKHKSDPFPRWILVPWQRARKPKPGSQSLVPEFSHRLHRKKLWERTMSAWARNLSIGDSSLGRLAGFSNLLIYWILDVRVALHLSNILEARLKCRVQGYHIAGNNASLALRALLHLAGKLILGMRIHRIIPKEKDLKRSRLFATFHFYAYLQVDVGLPDRGLTQARDHSSIGIAIDRTVGNTEQCVFWSPHTALGWWSALFALSQKGQE